MKKREVIDIIFSELHICGCGNPEGILEYIIGALRAYRELIDTEWSDSAWEKVAPYTDGVLQEWTAHILGDADLLEHGGSVHGSWITDKGREFLAALEKYTPEQWLAPGFAYDGGDV